MRADFENDENAPVVDSGILLPSAEVPDLCLG